MILILANQNVAYHHSNKLEFAHYKQTICKYNYSQPDKRGVDFW